MGAPYSNSNYDMDSIHKTSKFKPINCQTTTTVLHSTSKKYSKTTARITYDFNITATWFTQSTTVIKEFLDATHVLFYNNMHTQYHVHVSNRPYHYTNVLHKFATVHNFQLPSYILSGKIHNTAGVAFRYMFTRKRRTHFKSEETQQHRASNRWVSVLSQLSSHHECRSV